MKGFNRGFEWMLRIAPEIRTWASAMVLCMPVAARPQATVRASVSSGGAQANAGCFDPAISADGRFVAFYSGASTLVPGDTNVTFDIFVRDLLTGTTLRASLDSSGAQANDRSFFPSISADGLFVAFESRASNLVAGDTNAREDIFVRDLATGTTTRVSVDSSGTQGNQASLQPAISADGRFVAWHSAASNLVAGDTNGVTDVFVHDRQTGITERISVTSGGAEASQSSINPFLSGDGRFVVFDSASPDLVVGDTNLTTDVFVRDRLTGTTERVSVASSGVQGNGASFNSSLSADGRFVAFESLATNLVAGDTNGFTDVFAHDRQSGMTERVSLGSSGAQGNGSSLVPAISPEGRFVAFTSFASNLVAGDTNGAEDIFLRDRVFGLTALVSVSTSGVQGNDSSDDAALARGASFVAFTSLASNLVVADTNSTWDIFVRHNRHFRRR